MDVRYINPFMLSISTLFRTMIGCELSFDRPSLEVDNHSQDHPDITGLITFSGDVSGTVEVCFSRSVAKRVTSAFCELGPKADDSDLADAIGELANIIAGGATSNFKGLSINLSLPTVLMGDRPQSKSNGFSRRLIIPCRSPLGPFCLAVAMDLRKCEAAPQKQPA